MQGKAGPQGAAGPRGEAGPPGQPGRLPSIEQVMPWLHMIFDAYEDYKKTREREAAEREALAAIESYDMADADDDHKKKKKKKHRKDKGKAKDKDGDQESGDAED